MFMFKKHLSRRTFLQGTGAMVALPFLDAMAPAQTPVRQTAAAPKTRFACFYVPHGATMDKWTPAADRHAVSRSPRFSSRSSRSATASTSSAASRIPTWRVPAARTCRPARTTRARRPCS